MPSGIITKGIGGFYYVKTENELFECKARGIFRKDDIMPLPGDRVEISVIDAVEKKACIDAIMPRETELIRPAVANVNKIAVVIAVKSPSPDLVLLDKLLITAGIIGIDVVICINKIDLDDRQDAGNMTAVYKKAGYDVVRISSVEKTGFEDLKFLIKDKVTVFAGQSGVGKSTILNHVLDEWVMETGSVSKKIERGKHTTRHAELIELDFGGYVLDTPGFSSFNVLKLDSSELQLYFREFSEYLNQCRFKGCSHISEPGCLIKDELAKGNLDQGRYERYTQLYTLLKSTEGYSNKKRKEK